MTIKYYIAVEDYSGAVIQLINNPKPFSYGLGLSRRNLLTLQLSAYEQYNIPPDAIIRLWRRDLSISDTWRNVGNFIAKTTTRSLTQTGMKTAMLYASSPEEIIYKSATLYPSGAAQTQKDGDVAQVLREFVRENAGEAALASNGRDIDNVNPIATPNPSPVGLNWRGARSGRPLADVCEALVEFARYNGVRLDYQVVYNGGYQFALRVGILGTDRTANSVNPSTGLNGAGNIPVVVSPLLENMRSYNDVFARMNEANVVIALGAGEGADRLRAGVINFTSAGRSPLAQRESVLSANEELASGLLARAQAEIEGAVGKRSFTGQPDPTKLRLFVDYEVGDFITFEDEDGVRFDRQIKTADIEVDDSGGGNVETVNFEYDEV